MRSDKGNIETVDTENLVLAYVFQVSLTIRNYTIVKIGVEQGKHFSNNEHIFPPEAKGRRKQGYVGY